MRPARARVLGRFDLASRPQEATVTIDRDASLFSVLRRRRVYTLPLAAVAEIVVRRIIAAEVAEKKRERRARRRAR